MPSSTDEWTQSPKFASESSRNSPVPTCVRAYACVRACSLHVSVRLCVHVYVHVRVFVSACVCMVRVCVGRGVYPTAETSRNDWSTAACDSRSCAGPFAEAAAAGRRDGAAKCDGAGHGPIQHDPWRSQCAINLQRQGQSECVPAREERSPPAR